jgi:hypothetical protein
VIRNDFFVEFYNFSVDLYNTIYIIIGEEVIYGAGMCDIFK